MADRLQTLADKAEIADLLHTYALNIRNQTPAQNEALFAEDSTFEVRDANPLDPASMKVRYRHEGRAAVLNSISGSKGNTRLFPAIHNLIVTLDGDTASSTSLMINTMFPGAKKMIGEYFDRFRREDGRWLFASRRYTIYRED